MLETSSGNYPVLLTSKTGVAPLTKQSIPRLELLSGVILARLASSVKKTLQAQVQIDKTYLWLHSRTTIYWIKEAEEWKQFVQNLVTEILTLTEESLGTIVQELRTPQILDHGESQPSSSRVVSCGGRAQRGYQNQYQVGPSLKIATSLPLNSVSWSRRKEQLRR